MKSTTTMKKGKKRILSISAISVVFIALLNVFQPKLNTSARCVIYDAPPRTGSSTVRSTLESCFAKKDNYFSAPKDADHHIDKIQKTFSEEHENYASVIGHITISKSDAALIKKRCGKLFYLTTSAPMLDRIRSVIKYEKTSHHGNSTLDANYFQVPFNESRKVMIQKKEQFLTDFPHPKGVLSEKDRLVPDYVIHKETFREEFRSILDAFGCSDSVIIDRNVHKLDEEGTKLLSSHIERELSTNDFRYRQLSEIRKRNKQGLEKAKQFA